MEEEEGEGEEDGRGGATASEEGAYDGAGELGEVVFLTKEVSGFATTEQQRISELKQKKDKRPRGGGR